MPYFNAETGAVGLNIYQVREAYPEASIPDGMDYRDCTYYVESPRPEDTTILVAQEEKPAMVNGTLTQQWTLRARAGAELASKAAEDARLAADKIDALWRAADRHTSSYISGVAVGILTIGVLQQKPKALAVTAWSSSVWAEYYRRKTLVTADSIDDHDFRSFGPIPHSVPELQEEVGL